MHSTCGHILSQGRHTIGHLEERIERGAERENGRRSSLKGRERAVVNPITITGTVLKATLWKLLRERRGGAHMGFSKRVDTILN